MSRSRRGEDDEDGEGRMGGTVSFAGWTFSWAVPVLSGGGGLVINNASYQGTSVLYQASQPFVLVPYHGDSPTFKDGLNPGACGSGIGFTAMVPTAPNAPVWQIPAGQTALNDNQYDPVTNPSGGVMVELEQATLIEPARAVVWAKMQAFNYQYVQLWEFAADGSIEAQVGLAGRLYVFSEPTAGHVHNFYFRLDFDIVTAGNNLVQESAHLSNAPGADIAHDLPLETHRTSDPATRTTWRVLNKTPKANGKRRAYEIVPGSTGSGDGTYSTADLWVVRYDFTQDGSHVTCNDAVLSSQYQSGESVDGEDVVVWYCLREHHAPRQAGEERRVVPYEFHGFHMKPRDFLDDTPTNLYPTSPSSPL
jgi:Cu2+-containing amine oxidase